MSAPRTSSPAARSCIDSLRLGGSASVTHDRGIARLEFASSRIPAGNDPLISSNASATTDCACNWNPVAEDAAGEREESVYE